MPRRKPKNVPMKDLDWKELRARILSLPYKPAGYAARINGKTEVSYEEALGDIIIGTGTYVPIEIFQALSERELTAFRKAIAGTALGKLTWNEAYGTDDAREYLCQNPHPIRQVRSFLFVLGRILELAEQDPRVFYRALDEIAKVAAAYQKGAAPEVSQQAMDCASGKLRSAILEFERRSRLMGGQE